jgi:hypothetical protein
MGYFVAAFFDAECGPFGKRAVSSGVSRLCGSLPGQRHACARPLCLVGKSRARTEEYSIAGSLWSDCLPFTDPLKWNTMIPLSRIRHARQASARLLAAKPYGAWLRSRTPAALRTRGNPTTQNWPGTAWPKLKGACLFTTMDIHRASAFKKRQPLCSALLSNPFHKHNLLHNCLPRANHLPLPSISRLSYSNELPHRRHHLLSLWRGPNRCMV